MVSDTFNLLISFMTLTGNDEHIARSQIGQRPLQCLGARSRIRRSSRPDENLRPDALCVFGARIIVGHPNAIGALDGDAAHDRSLL